MCCLYVARLSDIVKILDAYMLTKGVLFPESVWNGGVFYCKILGRDSNIPIWKGVYVRLERGW